MPENDVTLMDNHASYDEQPGEYYDEREDRRSQETRWLYYNW